MFVVSWLLGYFAVMSRDLSYSISSISLGALAVTLIFTALILIIVGIITLSENTAKYELKKKKR